MENVEYSRRVPSEFLFTAPNSLQYLSDLILFEEMHRKNFDPRKRRKEMHRKKFDPRKRRKGLLRPPDLSECGTKYGGGVSFLGQ